MRVRFPSPPPTDGRKPFVGSNPARSTRKGDGRKDERVRGGVAEEVGVPGRGVLAVRPGQGGVAEEAGSSVRGEVRSHLRVPADDAAGRAAATGGETMRLDEYQAWAKANTFHDGGGGQEYPALALCEESGEFAGKVKKMSRDDGGVLTDERRAAMASELGDVLFYLAMAARSLGMSLEDLADANVRKVEGRNARGTRGGSGDDR